MFALCTLLFADILDVLDIIALLLYIMITLLYYYYYYRNFQQPKLIIQTLELLMSKTYPYICIYQLQFIYCVYRYILCI